MINSFFKNDPSKKDIREVEEFFDYKKTRPIKYGQKFWQLRDELARNSNVQVSRSMNYTSTSIPEIKKSYSLWEFLGISIQEVSILRDDSIFKDGENIIIGGNLLDYIYDDTPDKLPISCKSEGQAEGGIVSCNLENRNGEKSTVFQRIFLPPFGNLITSCVYTHEITHTQMIVSGGGGFDFLNSETIPIFMELIAAYYNDPSGETLRHIHYFRLANIIYYLDNRAKKKLNFKNKVACDIYIKSIIQATKLANIYFSSSDQVRKEMLEYINSLFNGNRNLDEMLGFYSINFRDCNLASLELKRIR